MSDWSWPIESKNPSRNSTGYFVEHTTWRILRSFVSKFYRKPFRLENRECVVNNGKIRKSERLVMGNLAQVIWNCIVPATFLDKTAKFLVNNPINKYKKGRLSTKITLLDKEGCIFFHA